MLLTSNGSFTWLLTIINSVVAFTNSHPDLNIAICDIIKDNAVNIRKAIHSQLARQFSVSFSL